jgi:hypothetical protein
VEEVFVLLKFQGFKDKKFQSVKDETSKAELNVQRKSSVGEDGARRKSWRVLIRNCWCGKKRKLSLFGFTERPNRSLDLKLMD